MAVKNKDFIRLFRAFWARVGQFFYNTFNHLTNALARLFGARKPASNKFAARTSEFEPTSNAEPQVVQEALRIAILDPRTHDNEAFFHRLYADNRNDAAAGFGLVGRFETVANILQRDMAALSDEHIPSGSNLFTVFFKRARLDDALSVQMSQADIGLVQEAIESARYSAS